MDWTQAYQRVFFVLYIILCGSAVFFYARRKPVNGDAKEGTEQKRKWICFGLFMLLALGIRLWKFGVIPSGMNQDGAMAAVDAKALADYGTDRFGMFLPAHFTAWGYGQMSVFLSYCMAPLFKLFGMSAVTARLPVLVASMAGLAALFGISDRILGPRGALLTLAFAACNPWHFTQSRWALDCNMFPHVFLMGLFFLLVGMRNKKWALYLSMVFFACCMYCYGIAFYTVPVFLLIMGIYLLVKKIVRPLELLCCMVVYFGISWPIYLTMMINAFGWKTIRLPFCTMAYFPGSVRSGDILFFSENKGRQLLENLKSLWNVYLVGDYLPWNTVAGFGAVTFCFLPFAVLGLVRLGIMFWKEKDEIRKAGFLAIFLYFVIGNASGLITQNVNVNRINLLFYAVIMLVGFGLEFSFANLRLFSVAIAVGYLAISVLFLKTYFTDHADMLKYYYFDNFIEVVHLAKEMFPGARYCITPVVRGNEAASNTAEILTLYAQEVDAAFFQGKKTDQNGLSYQERYQYRVLLDQEMPDASTVYVITKWDGRRAIWDDCVLIPCGDYYLAVCVPQ